MVLPMFKKIKKFLKNKPKVKEGVKTGLMFMVRNFFIGKVLK